MCAYRDTQEYPRIPRQFNVCVCVHVCMCMSMQDCSTDSQIRRSTKHLFSGSCIWPWFHAIHKPPVPRLSNILPLLPCFTEYVFLREWLFGQARSSNLVIQGASQKMAAISALLAIGTPIVMDTRYQIFFLIGNCNFHQVLHTIAYKRRVGMNNANQTLERLSTSWIGSTQNISMWMPC